MPHHEAVPRFFVSSDQVSGGSATLLGNDAEHLARSLRVRKGELVVVVEAGRIEHGVRVDAVSPSRVEGTIAWSRPVTGEPATSIHVLQALPAKGMELAVEALSEVGTAAIHPVITSHTVSRPHPASREHRLERWRTIAREAAQLAGRGRAPEVHPVRPLGDAVEKLPHGSNVITLVIDATARSLQGVELASRGPLALAVGPEGGFDAADRELLRDAGSVDAHLGQRVLPSWLAGAVAVSLLLARSGDIDTSPVPPPS